ncbi:MAG: MOSC N-terminal beta barrel domain-containing protein, partial [Actinomycetota bacterium]
MTGTVTELWRYPVKSMLGERLDSTGISEHGVTGDRAFALIDEETGKVCSAKRHDLWGGLFGFRAKLVSEQPRIAHITFPDGSEATTNDADVSDRLTEALGRKVVLSAMVPADAKLEELWDEAKGTDKYYGPVIGERNGEPLIEINASIASPGDFFDA